MRAKELQHEVNGLVHFNAWVLFPAPTSSKLQCLPSASQGAKLKNPPADINPLV